MNENKDMIRTIEVNILFPPLPGNCVFIVSNKAFFFSPSLAMFVSKFGLPHFKNREVGLQTDTCFHNTLLVVVWEGKCWPKMTMTLMHYGGSSTPDHRLIQVSLPRQWLVVSSDRCTVNSIVGSLASRLRPWPACRLALLMFKSSDF